MSSSIAGLIPEEDDMLSALQTFKENEGEESGVTGANGPGATEKGDSGVSSRVVNAAAAAAAGFAGVARTSVVEDRAVAAARGSAVARIIVSSKARGSLLPPISSLSPSIPSLTMLSSSSAPSSTTTVAMTTAAMATMASSVTQQPSGTASALGATARRGMGSSKKRKRTHDKAVVASVGTSAPKVPRLAGTSKGLVVVSNIQNSDSTNKLSSLAAAAVQSQVAQAAHETQAKAAAAVAAAGAAGFPRGLPLSFLAASAAAKTATGNVDYARMVAATSKRVIRGKGKASVGDVGGGASKKAKSKRSGKSPSLSSSSSSKRVSKKRGGGSSSSNGGSGGGGKAKRPQWRSFEAVCAFARARNIRSQAEWQRFSRTPGNRPGDIPGNPDKVYKDKGWKGYG